MWIEGCSFNVNQNLRNFLLFLSNCIKFVTHYKFIVNFVNLSYFLCVFIFSCKICISMERTVSCRLLWIIDPFKFLTTLGRKFPDLCTRNDLASGGGDGNTREERGRGEGKGPNLCRQYFYLSAFGPVGRVAPGALISGCRHRTCAPISCQDRGPWSSSLPLLLHRRIFIRRIWSLHVTPMPFQRTPSRTSSRQSMLLSGNIPGTCATSQIKTAVSLPFIIPEYLSTKLLNYEVKYWVLLQVRKKSRFFVYFHLSKHKKYYNCYY